MKNDYAGFYPFWFWNGVLEEDEIRWQINEMADKGIKGFFIHSRQGLRQGYLSETFFSMVKVTIEEAGKRGLQVHLYDEYPYPSGVAGGEVVLGKPEFMATNLRHVEKKLEQGRVEIELPAGDVLSCVAFPVIDGETRWSEGRDMSECVGMTMRNESYVERGLTAYTNKRNFSSEPHAVFEADIERECLLSVSLRTLVTEHKYWGYFVDVFNPEAIQEFIRLTHERYRGRFGDDFGDVIQSIFVDEITPHGWSRLIPPAFSDKYGYDLIESLPALHLKEHPDHENVTRDLYDLRYELFVESFEKPVSEWCRRHGILYSGEKNNVRLSQLRFMDIPGCDSGHVKAGAKMDLVLSNLRKNARAVASIAYFYDKPASLCECYHSMSWSATLQDAKLIAEGLLLWGVEMLVPHGFFYSTHALKKHDAPPSFFFQMPYWPFFGELSARIAKIAETLAGTYIDARILLIDPTEGGATRAHETIYQFLIDALIEKHVDFLIADGDILEMGKVEDGTLKIKDINIDLVMVPPTSWISGELKEQLQSINDQGITVEYIEDDMDRQDIVQVVEKNCEPSIAMRVITGDGGRIHMATRKHQRSNKIFWFLLNTSGESCEIEFERACLGEIDVSEMGYALLRKTETGWRRVLKPFESVILQNELHESSANARRVTIESPKTARFALRDKNVLPLFDWEMSVDGGECWARVKALPLANQLEKSGLPFTPDVKMSFGQSPTLKLPELDIVYRTDFTYDCSQNVELVMEPDSIVGDWWIELNGGRLTEKDFAETSTHVRHSLGVDVTTLLKSGKNTIHVHVRTSRLDGGLLNALYLAGNWGVERKRIGDLPEVGGFEDYNGNKIPYFAGCLEYEFPFEMETVPDSETIFVDFEYAGQETCEISINDSEWRAVCWEPRVIDVKREQLNVGSNKVKVRIHTTLIRSFEGEFFNIAEHRNQPVYG